MIATSSSVSLSSLTTEANSLAWLTLPSNSSKLMLLRRRVFLFVCLSVSAHTFLIHFLLWLVLFIDYFYRCTLIALCSSVFLFIFAEATEAAATEAAAPADEKVDETGLKAEDIDNVIAQTKCTRAAAAAALKKTNGDVVQAILDLSQ